MDDELEHVCGIRFQRALAFRQRTAERAARLRVLAIAAEDEQLFCLAEQRGAHAIRRVVGLARTEPR